MGLPKTDLQKFAANEFVVETARNIYSPSNQLDITKVEMVNGVDMGTKIDRAERATEIARNNYNKNNQYDSSKV